MKRLRNAGVYYIIFGLLLMVSFIFSNLWPIALLGLALLITYYVARYGFKKKPIVPHAISNTERLRNIEIYGITFGTLLMVSCLFTSLWPIALLGLVLLITYYILKYDFKKKRLCLHTIKIQLVVLDVFLVLFPFLYVILPVWYLWRPYKQAIILPDQYEGIAVVQYDRPEGQAKKWIGGFFGLGASRLIMVDSTGMAKSQFTYHYNAIPFLGVSQHYDTGGIQIYYQSNVHQEIITGADGGGITYENDNNNAPNIYFTKHREYPLIIFVITTKENYHHFFLSDEEKMECYKNIYGHYPNYPENFSYFNELNKNYSHYYDVYDDYLKKIN